MTRESTLVLDPARSTGLTQARVAKAALVCDTGRLLETKRSSRQCVPKRSLGTRSLGTRIWVASSTGPVRQTGPTGWGESQKAGGGSRQRDQGGEIGESGDETEFPGS